MDRGPFGGGGFPQLTELHYTVTIEGPISKGEKELENIVAGAVGESIVPENAVKDVYGGKVQETGVPESEQDYSVTVETSDMTVSASTLNKIRDEVEDSIQSDVTLVSAKAKLTKPVRRLVDSVME